MSFCYLDKPIKTDTYAKENILVGNDVHAAFNVMLAQEHVNYISTNQIPNCYSWQSVKPYQFLSEILVSGCGHILSS